eukprot:scaffold2075_cov444-Prasinococcus_capsulatus_cf.AAC.10
MSRFLVEGAAWLSCMWGSSVPRHAPAPNQHVHVTYSHTISDPVPTGTVFQFSTHEYMYSWNGGRQSSQTLGVHPTVVRGVRGQLPNGVPRSRAA